MILVAAAAIAAVSLALALARGPASSAPGLPAAPGSLPSRPASYLGVYEKGPPSDFRPVSGFAAAAGRRPNLVGYYGGWGEPFKRSFAETVRRHGAVTILQMDPTYASIPAIVAGSYDPYLRSFADSVRGFGHPVIIGFGHEMNADWYSWGYGHVPARTFVAAWRHIVSLFRGQGADNVTWLWTINQDLPSTGPIASWWPGAPLCHLGRHRRLLLPPVQHLRYRVRPDHRPGAGLHQQATAALGDRRGPPGRPVHEDPGTVRGDAAVPGPRAGVVRHSPAPGDLPSGLAYRRQPVRCGRVPAGRFNAGLGSP